MWAVPAAARRAPQQAREWAAVTGPAWVRATLPEGRWRAPPVPVAPHSLSSAAKPAVRAWSVPCEDAEPVKPAGLPRHTEQHRSPDRESVTRC